MHKVPLKERLFEMINGVLYVFDKALAESDISVQYFWKIKNQGHSSIIAIDHPNDKRKNIYSFDSLSDQYKDKIVARFGNPYDYVAREPIMQMVHNCNKAHQFFLQYKYGNKKLPIRTVKKYTRAEAWLRMFNKVHDNLSTIKKELGLTVPDFYKHAADLITTEKENGKSEKFEGTHQLPGDFPTSYKRIKQRADKYATEGYASIIDAMFGNQLASKVNDEVSEAYLLELMEHPNQYDDVLVCLMYNMWASQNNYPTIEPGTVGVRRRKNEHLIIMGREGNSAFNEKYIRQVKGYRPTQPLYLVEHDDNNLDFLFTDLKDRSNHRDYHRYVAICVTDSSCDLLLGKSYIQSASPEAWMVKAAYLDAMYYIRSITGGWYLPFEVKADRWAKKQLTPFYESIGKYVPPSHGNKHRGYIEQYFRSPLWKRSQKIGANNWNGNNMTAKYRGVNQQALDANIKNRPLIGKESEMQIEQFFYRLRHMPDITRSNMNALSKEQQWLQAWNELSIEQKRPITDEQMLLTFGIHHQPKHANGIKITNRGVEPQINGVRYSYDLPAGMPLMNFIGAKVEVIYDPYDMSRVLVTNGDDIRMICTEARLQPRALQDAHTDSRRYLNAVLSEKKEQVEYVSNNSSLRKEIVQEVGYNAEAMLQGGTLVKELKNEAEQQYITGNGRRSLEDMINQM